MTITPDTTDLQLPSAEELAGVVDEAISLPLGDLEVRHAESDLGPLLVASIEVRGDQPAMLRVACSEATARGVAVAWFGLSYEDCSAQDAADALSELANVVGGAVKPYLGGHNTLGLPVVTMPYEPPTADSGAVTVTIDHQVGVLLAVLEPA